MAQWLKKLKKNKALIISTLCMYSNNLRIMQNQEIRDNRSLTIIRSHISPDIYEVLGLPYHDFHPDMLTFSLLCFLIHTSSLTITPAHKNQNFHNHLISIQYISFINLSRTSCNQSIISYISIMQFLFND